MKARLVWTLWGLAGLLAGVGSALMASGGALGDASARNGAWATNLTVGSTAANPWVRARIARVGLLALTREETVYFDRTQDEDGRPLDAACVYRIDGGPAPARWWSITLYDGEDMLARNADGAASIDATRLPAGAWSARVAPTRPDPGTAWLSSRNAGRFSLTLRLYNPADASPSALEALVLPKVTRLRCGGAT
jgi:hypothetical protein